MSTLRVSNIEAKADASSPTIDEKVKVTSSQGRVLVQIDGKTAGITSIGINTTSTSFTIDANQNVQFVGGITAANVNTTGISTFTSLNVTGNITGNVIGNVTGNINSTGVSTFSSGLNVTGGSVGIGTDSTSGFNGACDDVVISGNSNPGLTFHSTSTTGGGNIAFTDAVGTTTQGAINYSHNGDYMIFQTGASERMRIDSSGRVTTPYQPAFSVSRQNGASDTGSHNVPQFTTEFFNIGNHFSLSTQRFTAPVSGTYLFTGHVVPTGLAQNSGFELWISVNSSTVSTARRFLDRGKKTEADSNTFSVGGSVVIYLAQNDWVQLTTTTASYSDETNCKFSGYLVG